MELRSTRLNSLRHDEALLIVVRFVDKARCIPTSDLFRNFATVLRACSLDREVLQERFPVCVHSTAA
jgi:hypothetical protein